MNDKQLFLQLTLSIPPQHPHLHERNKIHSSWKIIHMDKVKSGKTRLIANLENSEPSNDAIPFMTEKGHFTWIISIIISTHHFPLYGHNLKLNYVSGPRDIILSFWKVLLIIYIYKDFSKCSVYTRRINKHVGTWFSCNEKKNQL